jgi:hypothetical protein
MSEELSKTDRYNRNTALMNFCASSLAVSGVVLANWSTFTASFNNLTTLITSEFWTSYMSIQIRFSESAKQDLRDIWRGLAE